MIKIDRKRLNRAVLKSTQQITKAIPIILGIILLISLAIASIKNTDYSLLFTKNPVIDPLIGAMFGSIMAGNPVTSYIIGGELLKQGISLMAVTSFIVAWITVGTLQLPYEMMMLGKRFAIIRNIIAFVSSILVAVITVSIMVMIQ
ncbi:hypothetical protein J7J26_02080 [Candidatus Micrarchaeota archaeon]|nr:hypothetical protein [Candidatus Micrarchaeota archaeon]